MREFRLGRNTTEHYSSFEELGKAFGCRPVNKRTKDEKKLKEQQEKFNAKHKCKACGQPLTYIGGNQMVCLNADCKGIKHKRTDAEGNVIVTYRPSYELLNSKSAEIANNIFCETK